MLRHYYIYLHNVYTVPLGAFPRETSIFSEKQSRKFGYLIRIMCTENDYNITSIGTYCCAVAIEVHKGRGWKSKFCSKIFIIRARCPKTETFVIGTRFTAEK